MVPEKDKESQADLSPRLVSEIRELVATARQQVVQAVNSTMVQTYWQMPPDCGRRAARRLPRCLWQTAASAALRRTDP